MSSSRGARGTFYKMPPLSFVPFFSTLLAASPFVGLFNYLVFTLLLDLSSSRSLAGSKRERSTKACAERWSAQTMNSIGLTTAAVASSVVVRVRGRASARGRRTEGGCEAAGACERVRDSRRSEKEGATSKRVRRERRRVGGERSAFASFRRRRNRVGAE